VVDVKAPERSLHVFARHRKDRWALDLATQPDCGYAWGEADAAQVWGEGYLANHEPTLAKRAFAQALEVRKRIQHPGVAETEKWLARVG
jgi:hypothetical protein